MPILEKNNGILKKLCKKYIFETSKSKNEIQSGTATIIKNKDDSELDVSKSIKSQFNLLRIVDNEKPCIFFKIHGKKYFIKIYKDSKMKENDEILVVTAHV